MYIGMLWYDDNDKRDLKEKIALAAQYYKTKYGAKPTVCYIHPCMLLKGKGRIVPGIELRLARTVLINHFWMGLGETADDGKKKADMVSAPRRRKPRRRK